MRFQVYNIESIDAKHQMYEQENKENKKIHTLFIGTFDQSHRTEHYFSCLNVWPFGTKTKEHLTLNGFFRSWI